MAQQHAAIGIYAEPPVAVEAQVTGVEVARTTPIEELVPDAIAATQAAAAARASKSQQARDA
ncbi:hypothetical protein ACQW02_10000 [Humitalea sp. 24SJ18S-53]|uniref:hypothetical protein n=1 Tax=Humitalea sp. 24SJ18S-53 TaxID=3422307 RepID=UPI003D66ECB6